MMLALEMDDNYLESYHYSFLVNPRIAAKPNRPTPKKVKNMLFGSIFVWGYRVAVELVFLFGLLLFVEGFVAID